MNLHYSELAPPLIGCLVCHTEGTITEFSPQRWWRSTFPLLKCSHCGSAAYFDASPEQWRIQYKHINSAPHYHYAAYLFRQKRWINEEEALEFSRQAYIQRHRLQQVEAGNLTWLTPIVLTEAIETIHSDEEALLNIKGCQLGRRITAEEQNNTTIAPVDSGTLVVTNRRLHFWGQERPWIYEWNAIRSATYKNNTWTLEFNDTHFIEHLADQDRLDAQLFVAVINSLRMKR